MNRIFKALPEAMLTVLRSADHVFVRGAIENARDEVEDAHSRRNLIRLIERRAAGEPARRVG